MNSISKRTFGLVFGMTLGSAIACSGEGSDPTAAANETTTASQGSAVTLDSFEVGSGVTFSVQQTEGTLLVSVEGQAANEAEVEQRLQGARNLRDFYRLLAPERGVPAAVERALSVLTTDGALQPVQIEVGSARVSESPGVPDTRVDKEVARNVSGFKSSYCNADKILEASMSDGWYRKNDYCLTERSGNGSLPLMDVRQGYVSIFMYRGSADLTFSYQATGATSWTLGATHTIAEGGTKAFWAVLASGKQNMKYDVLNATGDGYHLAIHSAKANYWEKSTSGNDYYQVNCECVDDVESNLGNHNIQTDVYRLEICAPNSSETNTASWAATHCARWRNQLIAAKPGGVLASKETLTCTAKNHEKVSSGTACSASLNETIRECNFAGTCNYRCSSTCTL